MSKKFLTSLDLNRNELQNGVVQNLATEPVGPALGQFWFNTSDGFMHYKGGGSTIIVGGWETSTNKGVANGYAGLDAGGKIPLSQLPASLTTPLTFLGTWNPATNTPQITSGSGTKFTFYICSTPGTTTIDGITSWLANDWIIFDGTKWEKISGNDAATSPIGKYTTTIGDGTATSFTIAQTTHGRGSGLTNIVSVYDAGTGACVFCDVTFNSAGDLTLSFGTAPAANQFKVVIIG